jgi:hypothetical protein
LLSETLELPLMTTSNTLHRDLNALRRRFWLHEIVAPGFFLICVGMFSAVSVNLYLTKTSKPSTAAAKDSVQLVTLSRSPMFHADGNKFSVLGLGQDPRSGKQIVWIKNISSNEIRGYRKGQSLFKSAVTVEKITEDKIYINNLGDRIPVSLE